jgi:hypothetical protein
MELETLQQRRLALSAVAAVLVCCMQAWWSYLCW